MITLVVGAASFPFESTQTGALIFGFVAPDEHAERNSLPSRPMQEYSPSAIHGRRAWSIFREHSLVENRSTSLRGPAHVSSIHHGHRAVVRSSGYCSSLFTVAIRGTGSDQSSALIRMRIIPVRFPKSVVPPTRALDQEDSLHSFSLLRPAFRRSSWTASSDSSSWILSGKGSVIESADDRDSCKEDKQKEEGRKKVEIKVIMNSY